MMGGYVDAYNEEKISKNLYHVKNPDGNKIGKGEKIDKDSADVVNVRVIGKTNKIVYTPITQKVKDIFLYPFVYGIPFFFGVSPNPPPPGTTAAQNKGVFILNSNGYYLNLNHTNKIFMTLMKVSPIIMYNGINIQNRLKIDKNADQAATAIFLAEVLIKCMVFYPHQINIKGNYCVIQTLE